MNKIFCLAIVLVAYAPISAYADCSLQKLAWVLANRETAELGPYDSIPSIRNDGVSKQYVSFGVRTSDKPCDVYDTILKYMANAVGDAKSSYKVCSGNCFTITYEGDYDPTLKEPTKVQSLIEVLSGFPEPVLGNITCRRGKSIISESGFAYIAIQVPLDGNDAEAQCDAVYSYLSENGYLDSYARNTCFEEADGKSALLEIWSTSCSISAH